MKSLLAALLIVGATGALAAADPIMEPYAPYKLVGLMPDTGQALLWADYDAEYRVVKVGDDLAGWKVTQLDPKALRVSLQKEDLVDELDLVRLPRPGSVIVFKDVRGGQPMAAAPAAAPAPAMAPTAPAPAAIAPTVIEAKPPAPAPAPAPAPVAVAPPAPAPAPPVAAPAPPPAPAPAPHAPRAPVVLNESRTLSRADVDREINDFDRLMSTVRVTEAEGGGFTIVRLDPKSWVASLGFREGDIVRTVAGEEVSTVEDAARVYARLREADAFNCEVDRDTYRVVLKYQVK